MRRCRRAPGTTRTSSTRSRASATSISRPSRRDQPEATPERAHDPVAAARARQSVRLPARPAADRAALRAGVRALGQAHRRRARAPHGQGGGDRAGRPRLPAVLGQQGRLDRGQQAVPADLRPRLPDPGAAARARGRRRRARRASAAMRRRACSTSRCSSACCGNGRFRRRGSSTGCRRARAS